MDERGCFQVVSEHSKSVRVSLRCADILLGAF